MISPLTPRQAAELLLAASLRTGGMTQTEWLATLGGPGSGNFGHSGRPGEVGGSGGGEGGSVADRAGALKRWFGDSKVVDSSGKPLVVYHRGSFDEGDEVALSVGAEGMHFGTKDAADSRPAGKVVDDLIKSITVDQDEETGKWFWSMDGVDSYEIDEEGFDSEADARESAEREAVTIGDNSEWDEDDIPLTAAYLKIVNPMRTSDQGADWSKAVALAKSKGHDGIVYRNQFEDKGRDSYIVFSPSQVKSVNSKRFDPNSELITAGGKGSGSRDLANKPKPKVEMRITFDRFNPRAYEFARRQSSRLITEVGKATKDAVRTMIGRAFDEGLPPEALKRLIRERVGLRSDQLEALDRYEEEGATPAQVDAYRRELLNDRAILIGRTETMRSANAGQKEMWGQAQAAGELPVNVKRIWIGTDDGFERPEHVELNDQVVGLNEPFVIPSTGREVEPGEDPNCRCGQGLVDEEAIANLRALAGQADRRRMIGIANQHRPAVARTFLGLWQSVYRNINQSELTNVLEHGNRVGAERLVLAALDRAERLALAEVGERLLDVMEAAGEATRRAAVAQGGWLLKRQPNQVHRAAGGPGSGNFGHAGRPGEVGGSADDGGGAASELTPREVEIIHQWELGWVSDAARYSAMKRPKTPEGKEFREALEKLPALNGTAYRATHVTQEEFERLWHTPVYTAKTNDSASKSLETAEEFIPENLGTAEDGRVSILWRIESKGWGGVRDITAHTKGSYGDQQEVVMQAGSRWYRVNAPVRVGAYWEMTLREHGDNRERFRQEPAMRAAGGPGSGNFGHAGRPGEVGGSGDGGGGVTPDVPMDANLAASMREIERAGNWKLVEREKRDDYQETIVYNIVPRYMPSSVKPGGGGEFSRGLNWYDSALADLDEKGQAVPKPEAGTREFPLKVAEPGILYRGMSAGEFEEVRRTGEIISHGGYNLGGEQEGLTYFSARPDQASAYAAGFTPFQYEPSFGRPAYVVAVRDPGTSRHVAGTDTDERGIPGRVPASSIVAVYEGRVFQVRAGDMDIHQKYVGKYTEGGRMSPSTSRVWRLLPSFSALGGPGSGNFGHAGRKGEVGGSSSDGGGLAEQMQVKTLPPIKDKTGKEFTVMYIGIQDAYVAFDGNKVISKVTMKEPNKVDHVFVDPSLRRRGIASAMYDRIEQAIGQKLVPSELQTDDGAALWRGRNKGVAPKGKLKLKINESRSLGGQLKALAHDTRPPRKRTRFPVGVKFKP